MPYSPTSKGTNRASASPSISSLINPPSETEYGSSHRLQQSRLPSSKPSNGFLVSPTSPTLPSALQQSNIINISSDHEIHAGSSVDIEGESRTASPEQPRKGRESEVKKTNGGQSTTLSSAAPSPKPARQKAAPPPIPQGNGLLSSALFGGPTSAPAADLSDNLPPTIILEISLKGESNKTINFARMAEERYGFNVLYPRIAAQQERLARVAAAGAALEQGSAAGSADEMSVDLSDPESNIEMSGIRTGDESAAGTKRKRAAKTEEYDKDDPFVDDSEMLWEEQAAASKDGFFVYSGPLVPEGEKPSIERAGGPAKRGRGRGRGANRAGAAGQRNTAANVAATSASDEKKQRPTSGPGSRGGAVPRKTRAKKSDTLIMDEKRPREKALPLAAKVTSFAE